MKAIAYLPLVAAFCALSACKEPAAPPVPAVPKIDGIECDAVCQARRNASGTGDFPALDTSVRPRKNGVPVSPAKPKTKE